jgi:hypothetical protein
VSSLIYPNNLPGLMFDNGKTPIWKNARQQSLSGKESRLAYMQYPLYRFELQYEFLRDNVSPSEFRALAGLYNAVGGDFDTFLYTDPSFNAVTTENFGTGDGATVGFQLTAKWQNVGGPGASDLIQNLNGSPLIYKNAVLQTGGGVNYTLGPTGFVTFTSAPAAAAALTWTGSFYYRCRFEQGELALSQFMANFWKTKTVAFQSIKL